MLTEFKPPHDWSELNQEVSQLLKIDSQVQCLTYQGLAHALNHIVFGLAQSFSHKKGVGFWESSSPYFSKLAIQLAKQDQPVHNLKFQNLSQAKDWIQGFEPTFLAVAASLDHPFTAAKYDLSEFQQSINQTRIFRIYLSHHKHLYEGLPSVIGEYDIYLLSYGPELTVALLGKKVKVATLEVSSLPWQKYLNLDLKQIFTPQIEAKDKVIEFESKIQNLKGKLIFQNDEPRIFDRAVFYFDDINGEALRYSNTELITTSLCQWGGFRTMDWLKAQGFSEEMIRGLTIAHHSQLNENFISDLDSALKSIRSMQNLC